MKKAVGDKGEALACEFLLANHYKVLHRNWRYKHLELDIIAEKDEFLVIVEVKTANSLEFGEPQELVTPLKQKHLLAAATAYMAQSLCNLEVRFDIIAIQLSDPPQINHIPDAFSASS